MKKGTSLFVLLLTLTFMMGSVCQAADSMDADIYFENGVVYTADAEDTLAEALAVRDGKIVFVGAAEDGAAYKASAREVVDLGGGMLLPGFIDSHIHPMTPDVFDISLLGLHTVDDILAAIEGYVAAHPEQTGYAAYGYMTSLFEGEELLKGPRKERLDAICPDKPIVVYSFDGHAAWLNSKSFELSGITQTTQSTPGGEIVKDDATGALWGTLKDSAMSLVPEISLPEGRMTAALHEFNAGLNALGYTSIMAIPGNGFSPVPWALYAKMEAEGALTLRIRGASIVTSWRTEADIERLAQLRDKYSGGLVKLTTAKFFADGVMDNESAHLLEPYADNPQSTGDSGWAQDAFNEAAAKVSALGVQVHVHAIGDAAVHSALDAIEYARARSPQGEGRNAITHLQLVTPQDVARFGELGVIAVANPYWHLKTPDYWEPIEQAALGARAERMYPLKSFADGGATLAFASDFPVTSKPNPFVAIETAVTRNLADGSEYDVADITDMDDPRYLLWPEERLTVQEAIRALTAGGAYAMFEEGVTGTLRAGNSADLVVIDQDLLRIDPLAISDTRVLRTYLEGKLVYSAQ